jgi:hypothetical protein
MTHTKITVWRSNTNIIAIQEVNNNNTVTRTIYCNTESTRKRGVKNVRERIIKDKKDNSKTAITACIVEHMLGLHQQEKI